MQPGNSERALGMSVMENLLTLHPDLRAVFATNDQMALGAVEAVAARNLTGKVAVIGIDATRKIAGEGIVRDWPRDLVMSDAVKQLVTRRWKEYGL